MDTYSILRQFADSWGLLAMFLFFAGIVVYTFRPGGKEIHRDAADIPLRHGDVLEDEDPEPKPAANPTTKEGRA